MYPIRNWFNKTKYDICYEEGKTFGFIPKDKNGEYLGCPGEYSHPGSIEIKCLKCIYLERK